MVNYLKLTSVSKKYLENLAPFDENALTVDSLRARPDVELCNKISVNIEHMYTSCDSGKVKVTIYRPQGSYNQLLPALVYM
jgi:hypothetical protein